MKGMRHQGISLEWGWLKMGKNTITWQLGLQKWLLAEISTRWRLFTSNKQFCVSNTTRHFDERILSSVIEGSNEDSGSDAKQTRLFFLVSMSFFILLIRQYLNFRNYLARLLELRCEYAIQKSKETVKFWNFALNPSMRSCCFNEWKNRVLLGRVWSLQKLESKYVGVDLKTWLLFENSGIDFHLLLDQAVQILDDILLNVLFVHDSWQFFQQVDWVCNVDQQ